MRIKSMKLPEKYLTPTGDAITISMRRGYHSSRPGNEFDRNSFELGDQVEAAILMEAIYGDPAAYIEAALHALSDELCTSKRCWRHG